MTGTDTKARGMDDTEILADHAGLERGSGTADKARLDMVFETISQLL